MEDISLDTIEFALRDGSLESDPEKARRYLRATHGIQKGENPAFHVRLEQASQSLRLLVSLADSRESSQQALRWSRIAGWAAIVAAVLAALALIDPALRWLRGP